LKNYFKFQAKPFNTTLDMKKIFAILASVIAVVSSSQAALITSNQTSTWNLTTTSQSFTFNQFNSALGTLTAVDLIFNSATLAGGLTLTATSSPRKISGLGSYISVTGTGITSSADTALYTSFGFTGTKTNIPTTGRTFTINGSQSAVAAPETLSLLDDAPTYASFIGGGTFNFGSFLSVVPLGTNANTSNLTVTGDTLASVANVTLRYTYTDTSTVPEPSQVAASLLVIGGLGIYFLRRRRKVAAL
jgi:hypothetical protein